MKSRRATERKSSMKISEPCWELQVLRTKSRYSSSPIHKSSKSRSLKISITCWTQVRFQIFSHPMRRLQYVTNLLLKLEMSVKVTVEIKYTPTLCPFVVRIFTSFLHSLQLVINSVIGADSSLVLSTAAQLIGTIHGQVMHFTQLLIGSTPLMSRSWVLLNTWTTSAIFQWRFITLWVKLQMIFTKSWEERIILRRLHIWH